MRYQLRAIGPGGRLESVECHAPDAGAARRQAENRGYTVLSVRARRGLETWFGGDRFPMLLFSQELLVLLQAGLSLVGAIETLAEKERRPAIRGVLERLAAVLRQGKPLSVALELEPGCFSPLYAATVRAAERTSDLAPALSRFIAYETQLEAIRKRVVSASIYPLLLLGVGGLVGLFLLFYVVPRFARIYEDRAADLPLFSQLLLAWGQLVHAHGTIALGALAGVAFLLWKFARPLLAGLEQALLRVPAVGERLRVYQLTRFYRTAGMLLGGGMPLVAALDMAGVLLRPALRGQLAEARLAISEGRGVAASMESNGLATPVALRMLAVGESGGSMGEMMERMAAFHDEELSRWVDWFTRLFEPLLMALIGLVIGTIVVLMYMPIFELAGNLQ